MDYRFQNLAFAIGLTGYHEQACKLHGGSYPMEASIWAYAIGTFIDYMREAFRPEAAVTAPAWYSWVNE